MGRSYGLIVTVLFVVAPTLGEASERAASDAAQERPGRLLQFPGKEGFRK